jgi:subtilisin family serine protease
VAGLLTVPPQVPIDPGVLAELDRSADGQADFLVYFKDQADLSPAYHIQDWTERGRFVYRALTGVAKRTQARLQADLTARRLAGRVSRFQSFWIVNLIAARGDREAILAAASRPEVARILAPVRLAAPQPVWGPSAEAPQGVEWNIQKIRADQVWATYGVTGTGIVVANIDTGVDYTHPALIRQYRGNLGGTFDHNYNWWEPGATGSSVPRAVEGNAHGTHVMGTQVGSDGGANQIGVAPGAKWIAAFGCCPNNEALLDASQWMLAPTRLDGSDPDPARRPHVVQNSWGGPGGSLIFNAILEAQRAAGIFPSFAAGNEGSSGCGTLGSPGDNPAAFNAGAVNSSDQAANFSSRGPNPFSGQTGPAVVAPGVSVRSSIPGGGYTSGSGTSFAGPHVAGLVALLLAVEPRLIGQVDQIEEIIRKTAVPLTGGPTCGGVPGSQVPNNTYGWGRIDAMAAADLVWHAGILTGQVAYQAGGKPVPVAGAVVSATRNGYTLSQRTDANGRYRLVVGAGSYDVTVEAFGFQPDQAFGLAVVQDGVTSQNFAVGPLPTARLSGTVFQQMTATALPATITLLNTPLLPIQTDRWTGVYSATVPPGSYTLRATADGHLARTTTITVTGDTIQDLGLVPAPDYAFIDNASACPAPFHWLDATAGGTQVTGFTPDGDDGYRLVNLPPGHFTFYGNTYTSLYVSTNGLVSFGQGYERWHGMIPFEGPPNNAIYGLGEDLNPANGTQGKIWTRLVDDRWFVIEYDRVEHWSSGNPETFEIILDLVGGGIKLQYQQVSWPDFTSVGLENQTGSRGVAYSLANSANLQAGRAVEFYPFTGRRPPCTAPFPDFNTDGQVDVIDVQAASAHWGSPHTDAAYDPLFDLNSDGSIDTTDLQLVAARWLQPRPF